MWVSLISESLCVPKIWCSTVRFFLSNDCQVGSARLRMYTAVDIALAQNVFARLESAMPERAGSQIV